MAETTEKTAEPETGTGSGTDTKTTEPGDSGTGSTGEKPNSEPEDLSAEVEKWKSLSRKNEKELRSAQSELEKIQTSQMSEQEKAVATARAEGAREVTERTTVKLIEAEIRAAAAGVLADPTDALALISVEDFVPEGNADIDSVGIAARVAELVRTKPYLAATTAPLPRGNVAGGAMGDTPDSFTREQLRDPSFYEKNEEAILKAAREGRITN